MRELSGGIGMTKVAEPCVNCGTSNQTCVLRNGACCVQCEHYGIISVGY